MDTKDILVESLEKFCTNSSGECKNSFFENWFTNNGKTYNFIFKQNLFVTNLQFRELIDLIRLNVIKNNERPQINFMTTHEFIDLTSNIIESYIDEKVLKNLRNKEIPSSEIHNTLQIICKNYRNLFENTIVIDAFYTSCIVSVPCSLEIDIQKICFQSGYIHSCGENIYTRNMKKAKYDSFVEKLANYLINYEKPLNFIMYTHEDFPIKNKLYVNDFQKHGLDEIKFYLEKFYMQNISLMQIVENLKTDARLNNKIKVIKKNEAKKNNSEECIWMIIDRSIGNDLKYPGEKKYYICYKQMYINENVYHIFDENKPGWINSVTIPHTLVGAMLNIARGECPNNGQKRYKVIDPFVGTGTTFLEALKYNDIDFNGGDKCKISQIITKINLRFFSTDISVLKKFQELLLDYIKELNHDIYNNIIKEIGAEVKDEDGYIQQFIISIKNAQLVNRAKFFAKEEDFVQNFPFLNDEFSKAVKENITSKDCEWLNNMNIELISQILILLFWRTYKHNEFRYADATNYNLIKDSVNEFKGFLYRLSSYIHLRDRSKDAIIDPNSNSIMVTYQGKYTKACTINSAYIGDKIDYDISRIQQGIDVINFLKRFEEDKVDIIITDPPYGFNTEEEKVEFSQLYIEFINAMVKTMNNGGQIIMCLPAISYSGKAVNVFAQKEIVSRQFMIAAQENDMIIAANDDNFPNPKEIYSFPFYWDSEKALRRDIVRFQFFKKN